MILYHKMSVSHQKCHFEHVNESAMSDEDSKSQQMEEDDDLMYADLEDLTLVSEVWLEQFTIHIANLESQLAVLNALLIKDSGYQSHRKCNNFSTAIWK